MSTRLADARRALVDLAFPPACVFCLEHLLPDYGPPFCPGCLEALAGELWQGCPRCAAPLAGSQCGFCARRRYGFDGAWALGPYEGPWKEAVLRGKQARFEPLALGLGRLLGERLGGRLPPGKQLATAVPIHWLRRWTRGVHGAGLLAEGFSAAHGIPCKPLLRSVRRTLKQGTLSPQERFSNVRGAFRLATSYDLRGASVLLFDDVMTTGATLSEAARVLKRAGAAKVLAVVVARGTGRREPLASRNGAQRPNRRE